MSEHLVDSYMCEALKTRVFQGMLNMLKLNDFLCAA